MVGCLTGIAAVLFCVTGHFVILFIYAALFLRFSLQIDPKIKKLKLFCWATVLILLLWLLLMPLNDSSTIFSTNYALSLLMPVML